MAACAIVRSQRGPETVAVRDMARDFAAEKIAPHALRWDEEKFFPVDVMREAASARHGRHLYPDDVGGSALTRFDAALIFEALATGLSDGVGVHLDPQHGVLDDRCLSAMTPSARSGCRKLCTMDLLASYCLTEPGSGSDAAALAHPRGARRRPLRAQRPEAIHLRRRWRRSLCRDGADRRRWTRRHLDAW